MKKLLVVVDMQNDFITGSLGTAEAQAIVEKVEKKLLTEKIKGSSIVFTRDTHSADYLSTQEGRKLPVVHCQKDSDGWQIAAPLQSYAKTVFDKPTFGSLQLAEYVKNGKFDEVELVGVCTDICVVSNALLIKAYCPEMLVSVDSSCCAGVTPDAHEAALAIMKQCQVVVR